MFCIICNKNVISLICQDVISLTLRYILYILHNAIDAVNKVSNKYQVDDILLEKENVYLGNLRMIH